MSSPLIISSILNSRGAETREFSTTTRNTILIPEFQRGKSKFQNGGSKVSKNPESKSKKQRRKVYSKRFKRIRRTLKR